MPIKKSGWKKLKSNIIHKTNRLTIREDAVQRADGSNGSYLVVDNKAGVYIVPVADNGDIYLVKQYRYPTNTITWELPGGGANASNILQSAKNELWEETNIKAKQWKKIAAFESMNSWSPENTHVYVATGLRIDSEDNDNEDGILEVKKMSLNTALQWVRDGKINSSQTMATLLKYYLWKKFNNTQ